MASGTKTEIINSYNDGEVTGSQYLGGILGRVHTGEVIIRKCSNNNKVTQINASCSAGIAGSTSSQTQIIDCSNTGEILNISSTNGDGKRIGGIVGSTGSSKVIRCFNTGTIKSINVTEYMGGIVGHNYNNSIIENCYNAGNIVCEDRAGLIGGITGRNYGGSNQIKNCYNVGKIQYKSASKPGGILGYNYNPGIVNNSYYLDTTANKALDGGTTNVTNCTSKTSEEMRDTSENTSFVTLLETDNAEADKPVWLPDTTNMNGGYPILAWQKEN